MHKWNELSESTQKALKNLNEQMGGGGTPVRPSTPSLMAKGAMNMPVSMRSGGSMRSGEDGGGLAPPGGWGTGMEGQTFEDKFGNFYIFRDGQWFHLSRLSQK